MTDALPRPALARVLVVDDSDDVRELYAECLSFRGYDVIHAADGQQAVQVAFSRAPAVIVMDIEMPVMDGWTASQILRDDARTKRVPIIIVTGSVGADGQRASSADGVVAVIKKPCPPDVLVGAVESALLSQAAPRRL